MSIIRRKYFLRFLGRIAIFIGCLIMCFYPKNFDILKGMNFFNSFHIFHLLWGIWMVDMILQIIPIKNSVALGSQKLFANRFEPIREKLNIKTLKKHIAGITASAYKVFICVPIQYAQIGGFSCFCF